MITITQSVVILTSFSFQQVTPKTLSTDTGAQSTHHAPCMAEPPQSSDSDDVGAKKCLDALSELLRAADLSTPPLSPLLTSSRYVAGKGEKGNQNLRELSS